jgi:hypothetical protein
MWQFLSGTILGGVGNRLINVSGQHKDLFCANENKVTDHVSVSWAEVGRDAGDPVDWTASKVMDVLPPVNVIAKPYRCTSCNSFRYD